MESMTEAERAEWFARKRAAEQELRDRAAEVAARIEREAKAAFRAGTITTAEFRAEQARARREGGEILKGLWDAGR